MQVTLKKANSLQTRIRQAIRCVETDFAVTVTEHSKDVSELLRKAGTDVKDGLARQEALTEALFELREKVGTANAETEINRLLTRAEALKARAALYVLPYQASEDRPEVSELEARFAKARSTDQSFGGVTHDEVTVGVLSKAEKKELDSHRKSYEVEAADVLETVAALNVTTKITLSPETVVVLKNEGVI